MSFDLNDAAIGIGSNIDDRQDNLIRATRALADLPHTDILAISDVYESKPWGVVDQPDFLNACILLRTSLSGPDLLNSCLSIEALLGRVRDVRWGPRLIDLDVLWLGEEELNTNELKLPHPHLCERDFVLAPLVNIAAEKIIHGKSIRKWLESLPVVTARPVVSETWAELISVLLPV